MRFFFCLILLAIGCLSYSQKLSQVDSILRIKFPPNGRGYWHYYAASAKLHRLSKPQLTKHIPYFRFYQANFLNTLCWPEEAECLLVCDTRNKSVKLVEPVWYSNETLEFIKSFKGQSFKDSSELKNFVKELQDLIGMTEGYPVKNTKYNAGSITFEVLNMYISGRIWRRYEMVVTDLTVTDIKHR